MAYNKKILIIEDDPDISMIEEAYLQASGFETKILADGMDAAQIAEEEQFDLVLLDLCFPEKVVTRFAGRSVTNWIFPFLW